MKKVLCIIMTVALVVTGTLGLCFGASTETSEVKVQAMVSSTVDISESVTITGGTYESSVTVSDFTVWNLTSNKTVTVTNIKAAGTNGWTAASSSSIDNAAVDAKYINLSIDNQDLTTSSGYTPTSGTIGSGKSRTFSLGGKIAYQTKAMTNTQIAKLTVTLSVTENSSSGGSSGDDGDSPIYNSDGSYNIDYLETVTWADGTTEEVVAVIKAIDAGELKVKNLTGWDVGAERDMVIDAIGSSYSFTDTDGVVYTGAVGETQPRQPVTLVIMDNTDAAAVKKWKDASGTEHAANFIIGAKYCLETMGYINPTNTAAGSWKGCNRRAWCNTVFYESMLDAFGVDTSDNFFKCVSNVTGSATSDTTAGALITTYDYFALPTMKEFTGNDLSAYVPASEYGSSQNVKFEWYTADNIPQIMSETYYMWTRSPYEYKGNGSPTMWNLYYTGGTNIKYGDGYPETPYGLAPFGCL